MKTTNNKYINRRKNNITPDRKRFLINAAVLFSAVGLIAWRMPSWGIMQVLILLLVAGMGAFQILLFFKLK